MSIGTTEFLYGINAAFETILAGRRTIQRLYINQGSMDSRRLQTLVATARQRGIPVEQVEKGRLISLSGTRENQGVVVESSPFPYTPFADLLTAGRLLLLDNIEDPNNTGAIIRSAEVLGFDGVLLPRRGSSLIRPSVVKVSAGAAEHMRIACNCSANQYVKIAIEEGWHVCALDGKGKTALDDRSWVEIPHLLLVIGGEDKGVGQFILNAAHDIVTIRQHGKVSSLNASVAAGIAMHAIMGSSR